MYAPLLELPSKRVSPLFERTGLIRWNGHNSGSHSGELAWYEIAGLRCRGKENSRAMGEPSLELGHQPLSPKLSWNQVRLEAVTAEALSRLGPDRRHFRLGERPSVALLVGQTPEELLNAVCACKHDPVECGEVPNGLIKRPPRLRRLDPDGRQGVNLSAFRLEQASQPARLVRGACHDDPFPEERKLFVPLEVI